MQDREVQNLIDKLKPTALRLTKSPARAEDLVQDTLIKVLCKREECRGPLVPWARVILRNTFYNEVRRQSRMRGLSPEEAGGVPCTSSGVEDTVEAREALRVIESALEGMPSYYAQTVYAIDVLGMSYREAAEELGVKQGTIMSRLMRGREKLAQRYKRATG